jgi:hypothetical protein
MTLLIELGALRQYRHNLGDGFVAAYDKDITDKAVKGLISHNRKLQLQVEVLLAELYQEQDTNHLSFEEFKDNVYNEIFRN